MYVQKLNENNNSTNPNHGHNSNNSHGAAKGSSNQQPRLGSQNKGALSNAVAGGTQYDPSQRQSTKRRPVPIKSSNQLRKQSDQEEVVQVQTKGRQGLLQDAAIIKNSDLQQLKSGFREVPISSKGEESIYALGSNNNNAGGGDIKLSGLGLVKQQTAQVQQSRGLIGDSRLDNYQQQPQQLAQRSPMKNDASEFNNFNNNSQNDNQISKQFSSPLPQQYQPQNNNKNVHSLSIVGGNLQTAGNNNTGVDKEFRQKQYQDELQRQIRERDQIRQRENDGGGDVGRGRRPGSLSRKNTNNLDNQITEGTGRIQFDNQYSQQNNMEQQLMSSDKYMGSKLRDINQEINGQTTFYPKDQSNIGKNSIQYQANSTKMDFPNIMTRGKVVDNRIDLELEARGSIFQGRDEKTILIRKKEDSQQAIKEALQKQIDEKNRKKEEEKAKNMQYELREEQRLANEFNNNNPNAQQQPIDLIAGRKTQYNNQHQHSIVGSGGSQANHFQNNDIKLPDIDQLRSPQNLKERQSPLKEMNQQQQYQPQHYQEENIMSMSSGKAQSEQVSAMMRQEAVEHNDQKSKQINDLSDMVKVLLEEQKNLKDKLTQQEIKLKDINERPQANMIQERQNLQRKQTANITKKASERVRSQNPGQQQPQKKTVQSADNKTTMQARKLKEQHAIEQAKIEAIQSKIDKARKKMEEHKKDKSKVALETRIKFGKGNSAAAVGEDNIEDLLYQEPSQDESDYPAKQQEVQQHVPLIGGRHKVGQASSTHHNLSTAQPGGHHQKSSLVGTPNSNHYQGNQYKGQMPATSQGLPNQRQNNNNYDIMDVGGLPMGQRAQKAPRGVSNKVSATNLPLSSIDQNNNNRQDGKNSLNIIGSGTDQSQQSLGGRYKGGMYNAEENIQQQHRQSHNNSTLAGMNQNNNSNAKQYNHYDYDNSHTNETVFNLDNDGRSEFHYLVDGNEQQQQYTYNNINANGSEPQENGNGNQYRVPTTNTSNNNYNPKKYQQAYSQQNQFRGGKQRHTDFIQDIHGSKEFNGRGGVGMGGGGNDFISKNPSTAAGSYLQGLGAGGYGQAMNSGGGDFGYGPINESFDLDIMMPPDINSIDSDINKLGAMTPTPMQNDLGWGIGDNSGIGGGYDLIGGTVSDFGGPSNGNNNGYNGGGYQKYTQYGAQMNQNQNYNHQIGNNILNMGGIPNNNAGGGMMNQFDDSGSIYDSKYSPSRGGGGGSQYNRDMYGTRGTNVNNRTTITNN